MFTEQNYESGHTIYGQYSEPYVTQHLGLLAKDLLHAKANNVIVEELPKQWQFEFSINQFIAPAVKPNGPLRKTLRAPELRLAAVNEEAHWSFDWQDVPSAFIKLHQPLLSIETGKKDEHGKINWQAMSKDGIIVDDQGYDMAIQLLNSEEAGGKEIQSSYRGYWYNPSFSGPNTWYRFVVQAREKDTIFYSPAFN